MSQEYDEPIRPADGKVFYNVQVEIVTEDPETGKQKKVKEEHLVDGRDATEVEAKVKDEMGMAMGDWKITKLAVSKISLVY